mmetsp:Transcript_18864/g.52624  ORF Transcript_18864/g.52624 Transcript_18864/m.52624 type:complete len:242 (+) Transcript_18864:588-1313(+)|eukprot:CAMPEP_0117652026 /NCGR_PEP_ID=MMETSP0804-20121206/2409_1 /TAXON_ID=1074897 /ORGANISM="Tetraselmis astigmatica, Strain CCMP880" /LENGTH=241 /DNA_ID=CAMNT_0005458049 /DNA_START=494 /DNA_END=1219 /DNA_ORIENTATION=-
MGRPIARRCWAIYRLSLRKYPVQTQMVSTTGLWAIGDLLSQKVEGHQKMDWVRTVSSAAFAGGFLGPLGHHWYLGLDRFASRWFGLGSNNYLAVKVLADCFIASPLEIATFFSFMETVRGSGLQGIPHKLQADLLPTYGVQLTYWPLFQWFNFSCVPVKHQLLAVNTASIADSAFVCWASSRAGWAETMYDMVFSTGDDSAASVANAPRSSSIVEDPVERQKSVPVLAPNRVQIQGSGGDG